MKKIISILLLAFICTLTLCLALCGENNKNDLPNAVTNVINLISSISDVEDCLNAEKAYNELSEEEKAQVNNYNTLITKKEEYKDDLFLLELIKSGQELLVKEEEERKDKLKNPSSYTINDMYNIITYNDEFDVWFLVTTIDYSAQNSLGGYERLTGCKYYVCYNDTTTWREFSTWYNSVPEDEAEAVFQILCRYISEGKAHPDCEAKATFVFDDYTLE